MLKVSLKKCLEERETATHRWFVTVWKLVDAEGNVVSQAFTHKKDATDFAKQKGWVIL